MVDSQAIDATDLVVCVRDRTGRYVLINAGFEHLTGLPRERIQGKRDAALNPQDIAERVSLHDAQIFDTGAPSEVDEELLGREGRVAVRSCRLAICDDEGEPWAVCSVSGPREHVERVRAERDRLGAIAEGTPKPQSAVTSERLDSLVADLAAARETAGEAEAARAELSIHLEQEREARAAVEAELEETQRDLERTRHELEAAREELTGAALHVLAAGGPEAATAATPVAALSESASLVAIQRRVADLIADAASLDGAMRSGLAAFGELAGWDAAVGWLLARDGSWLRPASVWCSQAVAGSTFETQTWQAVLEDGPRAIAAAWDATETAWLEDAGAEEDRPRCRWARAAGLTSAAAVPVIVGGEPRGMIEVYRRGPGPRDEDVLALLETIAIQLGGIERLLELADRPHWR